MYDGKMQIFRSAKSPLLCVICISLNSLISHLSIPRGYPNSLISHLSIFSEVSEALGTRKFSPLFDQ